MIEIAEDYLTEFTLIERDHSAQIRYAYTVGGSKLHIISGGTVDNALTLCGCYTHQLVLVEEPVPVTALCDWCRAARDKL